MADIRELNKLIERKKAGVLRMRSRQQQIHLKMASLVESEPDIIEKSLSRVEAKLKSLGSKERNGRTTCDIYREWQHILLNWPRERIADLMRNDDVKHEQLKACAPFCFEPKCD